MPEIRQHRSKPDLLTQLAELTRRITALENARRLGNASVDGGELTVRNGDIVVRSSGGADVLRIVHGTVPQIVMTPDSGLDSYKVAMYAWESVDQGAALTLAVQENDGDQDGGKLLLMRDSVFLSRQPSSGEESYLSLGYYLDVPEAFYLRGKWNVGVQSSSQDAIVMGQEDVAAGFGAATVNFPIAFATTPFFMYSIFSAVGPVSHNITALSASSFTIGWSGTTAKTIYWQAWRR